MARPTPPAQLMPPTAPLVLNAGRLQPAMAEVVQGRNLTGLGTTSVASAAIFKPGRKTNPQTDRNQIAKPWQIEAYRQVNICGEARYAATLFANIAGRAEIGISEPQSLVRKPVWIQNGPEVDALAELVPDVRARSKLIRDHMIHRIIAGESYLIARKRVDTDPGYEPPPEPWDTWEDYLKAQLQEIDPLDPDYDPEDLITENPNVANPIWEIVAVTELQKVGETWRVKHDNGNWLDLQKDDPIIRMWNPDPADRREAWSPYRSMLPTLKEIEWLTGHIFRQIRSRLMSAGVWFLPNNLTFPPPPPDSIEGGAEAIAQLNEAEQFMLSLAASGMYELDIEDVSFPSVVMADEAALANIDQEKLIQFWSDIDDKAMTLRSDAVRRFALGMDMPAESTLGSSGIAVSGSSGSAGSVNHWGEWAKQEQLISMHVEPALDDFVGTLTTAYLRSVIPTTKNVVAYDTATLRLRQDRSKEAIELHTLGLLNGKVTVRESGFDPESDMMTDVEFRKWLLTRIAGGSATPEQVQESLRLLGVVLSIPVSGNPPAPGQPGRTLPPNLDRNEVQGPPEEQHDHSDAPFSAFAASCEALVLRALEKAGNRLLNDGKRGRDKDRTTPPHEAHLTASIERTVIASEFDFSLGQILMGDMPFKDFEALTRKLGVYCASLYNSGKSYSREDLLTVIGEA
jgi:hypothetical protein